VTGPVVSVHYRAFLY